jgi:predicted nucleic acid-binding protein
MNYFIDTSAFYACKDPSDKNYKQANYLLENIKNDLTSQLITSNYIIDESITFIGANIATILVSNGYQLDFAKKVESQNSKVIFLYCKT